MGEKKVLNAGDLKQKIFAAKDTELQPMEIPEWEVTIYIKPLTYDERNKALDAYRVTADPEDEMVTAEQVKGFHMALMIEGVRDSEGNPIFTQADIERLSDKSSGVLDRIATRITELSGFGPELRREMKRRFRSR